MMDEFFLRALLAGGGVALAAGPLGCVVIWARMVYFGAALSHSALLGIVIGVLLGINITFAVLLFCLLLAVTLTLLERQDIIAYDTLLGIVAHGALAAGLVIIGLMEQMRFDLMGYLFGDVLSVSVADIYLIYGLVVLIALTLTFYWRSLISLIVCKELAFVEGVPVKKIRFIFVLLVAMVIAVGMKIVGILLIVSLLIIPSAAARLLAKTPEQMAAIAALIGLLSVVVGLFGSLRWDIPSGPAIVLVSALAFVMVFVWPKARFPSAGNG